MSPTNPEFFLVGLTRFLAARVTDESIIGRVSDRLGTGRMLSVPEAIFDWRAFHSPNSSMAIEL